MVMLRVIYVGMFWVDLMKMGDFLYINEGIDRILIIYDGIFGVLVCLYVGKIFFIYLKVLFIYGDFIDFLFIFLVIGMWDMFLSDMVRVNCKMCDVGVIIVLDVYEGLFYVDYLVLY